MGHRQTRRIEHRLQDARRRLFIGREAEQALFLRLLAADGGFQVLYLHGMGGIGKTTLLKVFMELAAARGMPVLSIDSRALAVTPAAVNEAMEDARQDRELSEDEPHVVFLDTFESLAPLESWLRDEWLPAQPQTMRMVIAGRRPPALAWRSDTAWATALRHQQLENLEDCQVETHLSRRGLTAEQIQQGVGFARGYPLAMALYADTMEHAPGKELQTQREGELLIQLVDNLLRDLKQPELRAALNASAVCRVMSVPLLASMLQRPDASGLFDWLQGLSFMQVGPGGLFPHDLVRASLLADLKIRDLAAYHRLGERAWQWSMSRISAGGADVMARTQDLFFLTRDAFALTRESNGPQSPKADAPVYTDVCTDADWPQLEAMILRHEDAASWQRFTLLHAAQPEALRVIRDANQAPLGFYLILEVERLPPELIAQDAVVSTFWGLCRGAGVERANLTRFWMHRDLYKQASSVQALTFSAAVYGWTTRRVDFAGAYQSATGKWRDNSKRVGFSLCEATLSEMPGGPSILSFQDFTRRDILEWMRSGYRRMHNLPPMQGSHEGDSAACLERAAFDHAVRRALRQYSWPDHLADNPLLSTRMVAGCAIGNDPSLRVDALRTLLKQAHDRLAANPKTAAPARAMRHAYLAPAANQQLAADTAHMAYSTFRRHLYAGVRLLCEQLWAREQGELKKAQ